VVFREQSRAETFNGYGTEVWSAWWQACSNPGIDLKSNPGLNLLLNIAGFRRCL
jgi:hypothetical protein